MKICLIYLPHPYLNQPDAQAPLGILYLASVLIQNNCKVEVHNFSSKLTHEAITQLPKADIYGITVTSFEIPQANRFAHLIRERFYNSKIILGGPGTIAEEFVDYSVIDGICIGEGEITILDIIKDFPNIKRKYIGIPIKNLDTLPLPARHLLPNLGGNIFAYNKNYIKGGSTVILSSRGCPFSCSFCTAPYLCKINTLRFRSPREVYNEIISIIETYNIRQFRFSDDMFTANKKRVIEICNLLKPLNIAWRISCRVAPFDKELAENLLAAGCTEVSFGIESFDNNVLSVLNKGTTCKDNVKALNICDEVGIKTRILFMIRTPGQTKNTVPINIKWIEKVPYNIIACTSFIPIPGSEIWNNPDKFNIEIINKNLDDYNFYFFSSHGENKLKNIIKIKDRSLKELNNETIYFKEYLKTTGKLNEG